MGVVIPNMKMPSCCRECVFCDDNGDYPRCIITDHQQGYDFFKYGKKMNTCPLIQLPSQGMKTKYCLTCPVGACGGLEFNPFTELLECPVFNITTRYDNKTTMTNPNAMYGYVPKDK